MAEKEKKDRTKGNTAPDSTSQFDPLKANPSGETVCSPHFSKGCVNEAIASPAISEEEDENEKH